MRGALRIAFTSSLKRTRGNITISKPSASYRSFQASRQRPDEVMIMLNEAFGNENLSLFSFANDGVRLLKG